MKKLCFISALIAASLTCFAKVELPSIIGSNMVIQQNTDASLWGKATPKSNVIVKTSWDGVSVSAKADKDGRWQLTVKTPKASLTPFTISISDGEEVVLENVLVGDVWLCSGQSNMSMSMTGNKSQPIKGSADIILKAKSSRPIRVFKVPAVAKQQIQDNVKASWAKTSPDVVSRTSAISYIFADYIQNVLEIPIGIVQIAWGGSHIEAWISRENLEKSFKGKVDLSHLKGELNLEKPQYSACLLYNGMMAPLEPYAIKGILWYQGCSNRKGYAEYPQFQATLVKQIREEFKSPDAPFYFVQIAPYSYNNPEDCLSGYFCEAQEKSLTLIPNSAMATTVDVGEKNVIHPADKEAVAKRLAYLALSKTYGIKGIEAEAPKVESIVFEGNKAIVTFKGCKSGLVPRNERIPEFELAGADKVFHPAFGVLAIKKGYIEVSSDEVPAPVAVRYCWRNWCVGTLKNNFGIPVGPFRSDNWEYSKK